MQIRSLKGRRDWPDIFSYLLTAQIARVEQDVVLVEVQIPIYKIRHVFLPTLKLKIVRIS